TRSPAPARNPDSTLSLHDALPIFTDELLMQALPLESFVSVSADEALPNVLGLLLRTAVADGRISDEELLSVQPALEGRNWHANRSEEHTSELQSRFDLVCRLLPEK